MEGLVSISFRNLSTNFNSKKYRSNHKTHLERFSSKLTVHLHKIRFWEDLWKRLWKLEEHFGFIECEPLWQLNTEVLHCSWTSSKKMRKQRLVVPAYATCLPASAATLPVACLSPALESEQSRTSIDESGNRHREVLSKSWASSSVNWAVVSRAASMAWRMDQRRPEGICGQSGRKENNTYNRLQSYVKIILKEL